MAIKLIANYSKRLGLPGYSSHQFSIEVEAELATTDDVPREAARIYGLLQANVDRQILATGFVPDANYGIENDPAPDHPGSERAAISRHWNCTDRQRELIEDLVARHDLDKREVERMASRRFQKGVRSLSSVEASGLIEELIANHGERNFGGRSQSSSQRQAA